MNDRLRRRRDTRRRHQRNVRLAVGAASLVVVGIIVAIAVVSRSGDDGTDGPKLSAAGEAGKEAAVRGACVGCHGRSGEGVSAPAWVGLFGSTVTLDDGTTVVADRAYLYESIVDPAAKKRAGGWANMPPDTMVGEADIQSIIDYIEELATPAP